MGVRQSSLRAAGSLLKYCTIWKADRSPACRSVLMTLDALDLNLKEVDVNMDREEHKSPDLIAMNAAQTLPILRDRELVLCDSHAINTYLATRYGSPMVRKNSLLPKDIWSRSRIEEILHYDSGVLQPRYRAAANPILYNNCKHVMAQNIIDIESAYSDLEEMLGNRLWFGGLWPTLADITVAASVSTLNAMVPVSPKRFPRLTVWLFRISKEPFYRTGNVLGLQEFTKRIDHVKEDNEDDKKEFGIQFPTTSVKRRSLMELKLQKEGEDPDKESVKATKSVTA